MENKYKQWIKRFGIAGFLFFLIKGILWLIFGTAMYKWLKTVLVCTVLYFPFTLLSQGQYLSSYQLNKPDSLFNLRITFIQSIKTPKAFFCKIENQINHNNKFNIKFRLGSVDYNNTLEYSSFLQNK